MEARVTGGFGNKRGPKSSSDYERDWNVFQFTLLAIIALGLILYSCSQASAVYGTPQERAVCLPEFKRLCPSLTDDSLPEMLLLCVRVNRWRFSPACSAVLEQRGL